MSSCYIHVSVKIQSDNNIHPALCQLSCVGWHIVRQANRS